jgi:hypothetical protein
VQLHVRRVRPVVAPATCASPAGAAGGGRVAELAPELPRQSENEGFRLCWHELVRSPLGESVPLETAVHDCSCHARAIIGCQVRRAEPLLGVGTHDWTRQPSSDAGGRHPSGCSPFNRLPVQKQGPWTQRTDQRSDPRSDARSFRKVTSRTRVRNVVVARVVSIPPQGGCKTAGGCPQHHAASRPIPSFLSDQPCLWRIAPDVDPWRVGRRRRVHPGRLSAPSGARRKVREEGLPQSDA